MELPSKLQKLFIHNKWTLSFAESCTGGSLASQIVQVPDCSLYFLGSVVAYANSAKRDLLGVAPNTLTTFGAVSEETAQEMALGALKKFGSTYALATTGIAGPSGGTEEKPVGTVAFAIVGPEEHTLSWISLFHGERKTIIEQATQTALVRLLDALYTA